MTKRGFLVLVSALGVAGAERPAAAANTTCANAHFVTMGQTIDGTFDSGTTELFYQVNLRAGHSYGLLAWAPLTDDSVEPAQIDMTVLASDCATVVPTDGSFLEEDSDHNGEGNSLIPLTSGAHHIRILAQATPTNAYTVYFLPVETTLFSPYWQVVSAAGYDAAPQIANASEHTVDARVTLFANDGTQLCLRAVTLAPNGMQTYGISAALFPGCQIASGFGWARIAHTGPPGKLIANLTTFSALSGLSFDAPFVPVQPWASTPHLR